jgi:hypothetical protein
VLFTGPTPLERNVDTNTATIDATVDQKVPGKHLLLTILT